MSASEDPSGLLAWLKAIWDEDEKTARAVDPLQEVAIMGGPKPRQSFTHSRLSYASADGYPQSLSDPAAASHFSRYEPAAILTRIAAERAILEEHACTDCNHGFLPCYTQQLFAAGYSNRPGYREEWGDLAE